MQLMIPKMPNFLCLLFVAAILKDSDFNEVDRAECQFTTKATVLDNGSQVSCSLCWEILVHIVCIMFSSNIKKKGKITMNTGLHDGRVC